MINYGNGFISIELIWGDFKHIINNKKLKIQSIFLQDPNIDIGYYEIFAIDDNIVYRTVIYKGVVPLNGDIAQTENDEAKSDFETNFLPISNKRLSPELQGNDSALKVSTVGRDGSEIVWATHNFCDKTSWFSNAVRQINVGLTSSDGYTFYEHGSTNSWIDLYNGKVLHEDLIRVKSNGYYDVVVQVDGVEKTIKSCPDINCSCSSGDYFVNFESGSITFANQITGSVSASFAIPTNAWWILKPQPNTTLAVEGAEMQFSEDVNLKDNIIMQILGFVQVFAPEYWEGNGGPLPTNYKVVLGEYQYKSLAEFADETEGAYPVIPAIGGPIRGLKSAMYGMPFAYKTIRELYDAYGMEIRVGLKHDHQFGGFRATATFYCVEKSQ